MRLLRRRRRKAGKDASLTWQDDTSARRADRRAGRYIRARPFDMPPAPQRNTVLQRVRQITESLTGAIDEGSGAALDRLIESWVAAWIATIETDYTDHCAMINVHRSQAAQWLAHNTFIAQHEREELDRIRAAYLACQSRLASEQPGTGFSPAEQTCQRRRATTVRHGTPGAENIPSKRPNWAAPHLLAGRGRAGLVVAGLLILAGALTDTVAFKNTLELALPLISQTLAWLMAAGATSMALVAAASLGIALAIHRRTGDGCSKLAMVSTTVVWIGLGLAMFLIRWLDTGASTPSNTFGSSVASAHPTPLIAVFFVAIYLISGVCTVFEAERLYNPEYFAFVRLARQYRHQVQQVAKAEANLDRGRSAVDHHDGELDREDHRRLATIAERKALGAEAANYTRILMAGMLQDPAKTSLTDTGPTLLMPVPPPKGPQAEADRDQAESGVA